MNLPSTNSTSLQNLRVGTSQGKVSNTFSKSLQNSKLGASQGKVSSTSLKFSPDKIGQEFEAFFYRMVLHQMRESEIEEPLFDSSEFEQVQEMQDDSFASKMAENGHLGFSKMITDYIEKTDPGSHKNSPQLQQGLLKDSKGASHEIRSR